MGDITIIVRNAATGSKNEVELPNDAEMRSLLPILGEKLKMSDTSSL
ncbi:MAG: hypothetical protein GY765_26640 [bacterium]|nr:hypothetical protein [bacterium]